MSVICIVTFFIPGPTDGSMAGNKVENINDAVAQIGNSHTTLLLLLLMMCSIAFFNYSGVSVTKAMSATTRMVLDSLRTVTIWGYSLAVGWETFQWLQIVGFVFLLAGSFIYNDVIVVPLLKKFGCMKVVYVD